MGLGETAWAPPPPSSPHNGLTKRKVNKTGKIRTLHIQTKVDISCVLRQPKRDKATIWARERYQNGGNARLAVTLCYIFNLYNEYLHGFHLITIQFSKLLKSTHKHVYTITSI